MKDKKILPYKTIPRTDVNVTVQFNWMENGQLKESFPVQIKVNGPVGN
ncbi:MAG: hypothetical protein OIN90_10390 [Candidatus Methanoperedens sp.]|nr:hypothetical protein [Candidatus Methanoperedens sp.]